MMSAARTPDSIGGILLDRGRPIHTRRSYAWWDAQAQERSCRTCPKCGNRCTRGAYIPPHLIEDNAHRECGVIEHCLLCGWEVVHIWGMDGEPYTWTDTHTGTRRR